MKVMDIPTLYGSYFNDNFTRDEGYRGWRQPIPEEGE